MLHQKKKQLISVTIGMLGFKTVQPSMDGIHLCYSTVYSSYVEISAIFLYMLNSQHRSTLCVVL